MKFGNNLKKLRKIKKLSQEDLAEKVGVSRQSVSKWETGDAYPEMNNILELCKIFHCRISDLVNDSIIDIDALDTETKECIVKLKKEEQKKVKGISKAIKILAKIGRIACLIALPIIVATMCFIPYVIKNIEVNENNLIWKGENNHFSLIQEKEKIVLKYNDMILADAKEEYINTKCIDVLKENSKLLVVGYLEAGFLALCISLILMSKILRHLETLFENINQGDTPFTLENINHLSTIAWLMIATIIIPNIGGAIFSALLTTDIGMEFEMFDLVEILFMFALVYIFRYGHQIQLDSKGMMYGEEDE